jgi:hypothetical protein
VRVQVQDALRHLVEPIERQLGPTIGYLANGTTVRPT